MWMIIGQSYNRYAYITWSTVFLNNYAFNWALLCSLLFNFNNILHGCLISSESPWDLSTAIANKVGQPTEIHETDWSQIRFVLYNRECNKPDDTCHAISMFWRSKGLPDTFRGPSRAWSQDLVVGKALTMDLESPPKWHHLVDFIWY